MQDSLRLATLRAQKKMSQPDMARILNVGLSTYKLYEAGTLPMGLEELNILSNLFNVSFDYLLGLSNIKEQKILQKDIDYKYLRFCIRFLRKRSRISQKSLAKEFNVSYYSISKYEHNGRAVTLYYLISMVKKYHISADYMCGKSLKKEVL